MGFRSTNVVSRYLVPLCDFSNRTVPVLIVRGLGHSKKIVRLCVCWIGQSYPVFIFQAVLFECDYDGHHLSRLNVRMTRTKFPSSKPPPNGGGFRGIWSKYLVPREDMSDQLPEDTPYEPVECVLHRARIEDRMPDLELVRKSYEMNKQSEYMAEYCKLGDYESEKSRASHHVPLPPNWQVCETTYCGSYRQPQSVATFDLTPRKADKGKHNLVPNEREREILRVSTGDSEYASKIGAIGDFILTEKLYGQVKKKGISQWEAKRRLAMLEAASPPSFDPLGG